MKPLYGIRDYFTDKPPTEKQDPHLPCEKHPSKECTLWCNSCKVIICSECFDCGHDNHSVRKLKSYLMERIQDDYGEPCDYAFSKCGENAEALILTREAELETLKSVVDVFSEELRLAKLQKSIVDEYYDFRNDALRRNKDEQLETALLSKLVNFQSLGLPGVGDFQPRDFEISVKKKSDNFGFLNRNSVPCEEFYRSREPDIFLCKVLHAPSSIFPVFLAIPIRVTGKKRLQFKACTSFIDGYPLRFSFEPEVGWKKRDLKCLKIIATCHESPCFSNCFGDCFYKFYPYGMNYTFRLKNLFNQSKDLVTAGTWKNPMSIPLCFETLDPKELAYLQNGWIVKRDGEEYIDVSLTLTKNN